MDQHPIPQDVTGFQFKLFGPMTVKQFGFVASGVVAAVLLYYMPLPGLLGILIKVMFIPLLGGSGAFIAFVPIEGRPVDVMAAHFFKAVFSPNQYIYKKEGGKFSFSYITTTKVAPVAAQTPEQAQQAKISPKQKQLSAKEAQLQAFLQTTHNEVKNSLDQKEMSRLSSLGLVTAPHPTVTATASKPAATPIKSPAPIASTAHATPTVQAHPAAAAKPIVQAKPATPVQTPEQEEKGLAQKETQLEKELQTAKQEENTSHAPAAHEKVLTLQQQLSEVHTQKMKLEQELQQLKSQLQAHTAATTQPAQPVAANPAVSTPAQPTMPTQIQPAAPQPTPQQAAAAAPVPASQYAKTIAQPAAKKADVPQVSDTPNVVVGIVKDPRGNILPNMLVEVKDKDGNPVRAFKTNALGQFASATPLSPGVYTIELDDPKKQHKFDIIQITANNQIMMPIEIVSHDAREELRKQLFAN